ncbi:MAG: N-acetyltransferase [Candidatus Bathyarchaeota archaeon]|nr:N-acetyltransferase [Candidatus Bathyarchaeota archaeon]
MTQPASRPKMGEGVIMGENVQFGKNVTIWNYVIIGDNTQIGDGTRIGSFCDIGKNVIIGRNCIIQAHVTISNECQIGNNVFIGPNTSLLNDKFPHSKCLTPPIIKDNAIIGGCVTILPNVTVHENAVVAAGSVVTKDVPPNIVVKGIPARPTMTRQGYETKRREFITARKKEAL